MSNTPDTSAPPTAEKDLPPLLDDAHGLAAHVRGGVGGVPLELGLTQREVGILLLDQSAAAPFAVYGPDGALVAGDPELAADAMPRGRMQAFSTMEREGRERRRVSLHVAGPPSFTVVMAEATESRTQLLHRLLIYSGLAQLWLLVVLGSRLLGGIEKHLRPLAALQDAVQQRDAADSGFDHHLTKPADVQQLSRLLDSITP